MPEGLRRSGRANKGVVPQRYAPYTTERMITPDTMSTFASISDTSEDDLNNTIVPHLQQLTLVRGRTSEQETSEDVQQLTDSVPTQINLPRPVDRPRIDSQQDRLLLEPIGLSPPRTMPQSICQLSVNSPLVSATEPRPVQTGSITQTGREATLSQLELQPTTKMPPLSNQSEHQNSRSLDGLPQMTSTLRTSCQRPSAPVQFHPPVNTNTPSRSPEMHAQVWTPTREMLIRNQMAELERELAEERVRSGTNCSRTSSEFLGFAATGGTRRAYLTSTRSDADTGPHSIIVQADVHQVPAPTPHAESASRPQHHSRTPPAPVVPQPTTTAQSNHHHMQAVYVPASHHQTVAVPTSHVHPPAEYLPAMQLPIPDDHRHVLQPSQLTSDRPRIRQHPPLTLAQQRPSTPAEANWAALQNAPVHAHAPRIDYGLPSYVPRAYQQHPLRNAVEYSPVASAPHPAYNSHATGGANGDGYGYAPPHGFRDATGHRYNYVRKVVELPQFGGAPEDWPQFICAYETTTREYGYTNLENMGRIQRALTGEAKTRLRGILIRPEHVERSLAILSRAFGRPHILAESQLREIRKIPKIAENRLHDIVNYSTSIESLVSLLDSPQTEHLLTDYLLLKELTSKLPLSDQRVWAAVARYIGPNPSVRDFATWLSDVADDISNIRSDAAEVPSVRSRDPKPAQTRSRHILLNVSNSPKPSCAFCGEAHDSQSCNVFNKLSTSERLTEVRKRPLCYYCLGADHILPACDKKKECGIDGCSKYHHALLHQAANQQRRQRNPARPAAKKTANSNNPKSDVDVDRASTVLNCQGTKAKQTLFYRVVPVILYGPGKQIKTYALFDEGSSVSLIDADLADQLQLPGESRKLKLQFVNGASSTQQSRNVSVGISGTKDDDIRFDIATVQTSSGISLPAQTVDRADVLEQNPHLADVPFETFENVKPKILLGLEHHFLGVPLATRMGKDVQSIAAAQTRLGWVLYGSCDNSNLPGAIVLHAREFDMEPTEETVQLQQLHEVVRRHFTTEDFGVRVPTEPIQSDRDKRALAILASTTKRIGKRYETGLLWRQDDVVLPDSYPMALNRLKSVEAKMRRDPGYAAQYNDQIESYLHKGYARKMTIAEARQRGPRTWYLPHFAVQSASKPGKFRLVFDAAASTQNVSLNAMLLPGPDLNAPLTRILFRFRLGAVGVCADVREMFHQVAVRREDQDAQRFLWRGGNSNAEPATYVMTAMTFGSTCSPTSAQYVKNLNAKQHAERYPEAAEAIQRSHYVDDYVASFRTAADAERITADVIRVHDQGGFELRGVVSNCPEVRTRFGHETVDNRSISLEPEDLTQRILGMTWETEHDSFSFATRFHRVDPEVIDGCRTPTKREILSVVMSIFDPFGLLANFLLPSKVLIQDLWRLGVQWDDKVPGEINVRWQDWRKEIAKTKSVRIARCYSNSILSAPGLQLHVFADASEEAYAAVAYWRINGVSGPEISFVAGKARCSPLKILSIPRLELQAAVLATRLMNEIRESHDSLNISKVIFWSDSETVLKWLRCDQRRYVQFVAHRVAEIVEVAPAEWWRYVPTALNVADDATRVRTPIVFDPESRWLHGPAWLKMDETTWPAQPDFVNPASATVEELRPKFIGAVSTRGAVAFERFSNIKRLVSCVGWMYRFTQNARGGRTVGGLTANELDRATVAICRMVQEV